MYNVVICGAGLAGLALARQLKMKYPNISLVVVSKEKFPLAASNRKVGESTVEISAYYFKEHLDLKGYFRNGHFAKLGLRYFFNSGEKAFEDRPELGLSDFPEYDSYQIDRGVLENDLYRFNIAAGIEIIEGATVKDIEIADKGPHTIAFSLEGDEEEKQLTADWVVDATGRRCLLQKKYDLRVKSESNCSSAWFRVRGRIDVSNFVKSSNRPWHSRVRDDIRYFSTNHLMGKGYWVWVIPLVSGNTSVGIVTNDKFYSCSEYSSKEKALAWLEQREPELRNDIIDREFIDFSMLRSYAYSSKQVFSQKRWACIGDAGLFPDPFYSPGMNMIGFENTMVTHMVGLDMEDKLEKNIVNRFNDFIISYNDWLINFIHNAYCYFYNDQVMSLNYLWDTVVGWSITAPNMFNGILYDDKKFEAVRENRIRFSLLSSQVKQLFKDWEGNTKGTFSFSFIDYLAVPFIKEIYTRNLQSGKTVQEIGADYELNVSLLEEFAQAIFFLAVEDALPQQFPSLKKGVKYKPETFNLKPQTWQEEVGMQLKTDIYQQLRQLYNFKKEEQALHSESLDMAFDFDF